jgi:Zinc knuckle
LNCYHCHEPGHFAAACPFMTPAASYEEHLARIDHFVAQWHSGAITMEQKRHLVSDENLLHYGPSCRKALLYP